MRTVSRTKLSSKANWSCFKTAIRLPFSRRILPFVESISPESILKKVDFPAPFAPMRP